MQAIAVDVRTKIPAGYKDEKFNRINKGYVNFATAGNKQKRKSTKIWQQMPVNYFFNLLSKKKLYFKQFSVYDSRDERQLKFYENNYSPDDQYEQKMIDDFAKIAYISCWYQSDNLTDIVFKEYAKGSVGVAIGTTVELLLKTLNRKICKPSSLPPCSLRRRKGQGGACRGTPVQRGAASEAGGGAAGEAGTLPKWLLKASRPGVGTWLGRLRGLAGVVIGG